ncbi:hypothetical protein SAMN02787118_102629 [Streptomyces mirabilis]|uniref:Uncharacterized protein n=1 Tax=Streptomyces mirabilis TaxID=68239 RepID=A0A1I2DEC5_9ACTN|nr:hypothetical protein SAMN02787118_102629 [Streptomyces mirabilis]
MNGTWNDRLLTPTKASHYLEIRLSPTARSASGFRLSVVTWCTTSAHFRRNSRELPHRDGKRPDTAKDPAQAISRGQSPNGRRVGLYAGFCRPGASRRPGRRPSI